MLFCLRVLGLHLHADHLSCKVLLHYVDLDRPICEIHSNSICRGRNLARVSLLFQAAAISVAMLCFVLQEKHDRRQRSMLLLCATVPDVLLPTSQRV